MRAAKLILMISEEGMWPGTVFCQNVEVWGQDMLEEERERVFARLWAFPGHFISLFSLRHKRHGFPLFVCKRKRNLLRVCRAQVGKGAYPPNNLYIQCFFLPCSDFFSEEANSATSAPCNQRADITALHPWSQRHAVL